MIPLYTKGRPLAPFSKVILGKVTSEHVPEGSRGDHVFRSAALPPAPELQGYPGALTLEAAQEGGDGSYPCAVVHAVASLDHLADGDVVALNPDGSVQTLYRIGSAHNAIFATERCNSFCVMCSQPPREVNDHGRVAEHLRLLELMSPGTQEVGITGGEPTLLKDGLIAIVHRCRELLPDTGVHILSNGRLFYYGGYARELAEVGHPDLMVGIPLYSDIDWEHDYVVQCRGAFDETMIGLQNLGRFGVPVEVRVVIHRVTVPRLVKTAEYIYRNVPFASHVALMGLELMGFAVPNAHELWVDPWDYRHELEAATLYLAERGMTVSVYNHQLCTVPASVWPYCRKSISDWKNEYLPVCEGCAVREQCGGFFSSGVRRKYSSYIRPLLEEQLPQVGREGR